MGFLDLHMEVVHPHWVIQIELKPVRKDHKESNLLFRFPSVYISFVGSLLYNKNLSFFLVLTVALHRCISVCA
jgi:hypothetical protein